MHPPGYDYALIDADNHFYEPPDCFSRHIESRHLAKAITARREADGSWTVRIGDKPYDFMDVKFDRTNPPGSMHQILRAKDSSEGLEWGDSYSAENMLPGFQHREARLALMDEQGIEAIIVLPTFGVSVESSMLDDPEQLYANYRSFNRWLLDDWGFAHRERIFAPAMLSLFDPTEAVTELQRVMEAGARLVHLTPGPIGNGRSLADPVYDPFWARLDEAGLPVIFHIADSRYPEVSRMWGEDPNPPVRQMTAFQWAFVHGDRPIMETLGAMIYGNLFGRFPNLVVLSLENGSGWVPYLMSTLDKKKGLGRYAEWIGGRPVGRPSDTLRRHVFVCPYPEDDVSALVDHLGPGRVLFGSDFPHPEGLADPGRFVDLIADRSAVEARQVMRSNAAGLLGLEA